MRELLDGTRTHFTWEEECIRKHGRPCLRISGVVLAGVSDRQVLLRHENATSDKCRDRDLWLARYTIDHAADAIFWAGKEGRFEYVNEQACAFLGYRRDQLLNLNVWDVDASVSREQWSAAWEKCRAEGVLRFESSSRTHEGRLVPVEVTVNHLATKDKEFHCAYVRDISARRELEAQFRQAQKLEAVARLAGSVAHDFNNLLTVINGYSELLLERSRMEEPDRALLAEIQTAGARAAGLTRQLLAFSRKQLIQPVPVDLDALLGPMMSMLRRLIGEDVVVKFKSGEALGQIEADPGQVEQVIMNLAVNARDAMPSGGQFMLETSNLTVKEDGLPGPKRLPCGAWVALQVRDTGIGMNHEVQSHLFEPFFTTKEAGKGTGLGLSTVYGIVKKAGGHIFCHSEVGRGTSFTLLFPRKNGVQHLAADGAVPCASGHETVLLVEDDATVRTMARVGLVGHGYTVMEAASGPSALKMAKESRQPIDLVITDMVMPSMNGLELIHRLRQDRAGLPAILMTGFLDTGLSESELKDRCIGFLQKPFQSRQLAVKVREALSAPVTHRPGKAA